MKINKNTQADWTDNFFEMMAETFNELYKNKCKRKKTKINC